MAGARVKTSLKLAVCGLPGYVNAITAYSGEAVQVVRTDATDTYLEWVHRSELIAVQK